MDSSASPVGSEGPKGPPLPLAADTQGEIVLYNPEAAYAGPSRYPANSNVIWGNNLTTEEQNRVVDAVFSARHLTDEEQCPEETYPMKDKRASGYFVPFVLDAVAGAFTTRGTSEKLYLVDVGYCRAPRFTEEYWSRVLSVLRGSTVVGRVPITRSNSRILFTSDLDGDGRDEILLSSSSDGQGSYFESVEVIRMDASRMTVVKGWTDVVEAPCGHEDEDEKLSILFVTRGPHLRFRLETYDRPCHLHGY